jgi:hypothetical protein
MLRREAEQLQRQMEQLARGQQGTQSQQGQRGQMQASGGRSSGQQSGGQQSGGQQSGGQRNQQVERAMERLQQALRDMRQAASAQAGEPQQGGAEARRAAERLQEAQKLLSGMERERSGREMDDLVRRSDELAQRQRDFANRLRQGFGGGLLDPRQQPSLRGGTPQDAERLAGEKQRMLDEVQTLEADMQRAARAMAGTERQASGKVREALGNLQQEEIAARMKWSAEAIRRGLAPYAALREAMTTQALNNLAEQLKEAQRALGAGGGRQQPGGRNLEDALAQAERLRRQMQSLNPGDGRQGGGDRGQQQSQQGIMGRDGRRQGRGQDSGAWSAINRGDWQPAPGRAEAPRTSPEDLERAYQGGIRDLGRLQRAIEDNPELSRDVQGLIREMQRLDPKNFPGNPELLSNLHGRILAEVEQLELQLRRMVEDKGGRVRSTSGEAAPAGYADAVAEYFRRLSKTER